MRLWRSTRSKHRQLVDKFLAAHPVSGTILRVGWSDRERTTGGIRLNLRPFPGVAVVADATALPFRDETFDAVSCIEVAYLVWDRAALARELWRVVKPGGQLVITELTDRLRPADDPWGQRMTPEWWNELGWMQWPHMAWATGYGLQSYKLSAVDGEAGALENHQL